MSRERFKERCINAFLIGLMLFSLLVLACVPGLFSAGKRYPTASTEQAYDNIFKLCTFQTVEELEEQEQQANRYRITVTVTKVYVREVPDLSLERLRERVEPQLHKVTRNHYLDSYTCEITSITRVDDE